MSARYPASGEPPDDPPHEREGSDLPNRTPEEMGQHLVTEVDDIAIDIIEAQIEYWTAALAETRRHLGKQR